jgi:membrane protein
VDWRDVWVGAIFTSILFTAGKIVLGLYLGHSNPGEAFGAAGALAVMLVWIYYSSMITLFGAEFTQAWAERRGHGVVPERGAVRVIREIRREQPVGGRAVEIPFESRL